MGTKLEMLANISSHFCQPLQILWYNEYTENTFFAWLVSIESPVSKYLASSECPEGLRRLPPWTKPFEKFQTEIISSKDNA